MDTRTPKIFHPEGEGVWVTWMIHRKIQIKNRSDIGTPSLQKKKVLCEKEPSLKLLGMGNDWKKNSHIQTRLKALVHHTKE